MYCGKRQKFLILRNVYSKQTPHLKCLNHVICYVNVSNTHCLLDTDAVSEVNANSNSLLVMQITTWVICILVCMHNITYFAKGERNWEESFVGKVHTSWTPGLTSNDLT